MARCSRCGRDNAASAAACVACGTPLPVAGAPKVSGANPLIRPMPTARATTAAPTTHVRCPSCGVPVPAGFKFCGACGTPIPQTTGAPPARTPAAAAPLAAPPTAAKRTGPRGRISALGADSSVTGSWPLLTDDTSMGTAAEIRLTDPYSAPIQGRFVVRGAGLSFVPERSANGTFLLLRREHPLSVGSEFRVGRQLLRLDAVPPKPATAELLWGSPNPGYRFRIQQLLAGGLEGDAFPLREGENAVGRAAGDLAFPGDGYVSGRHATIAVRGDQVMVKDLGSSNGTFARIEGEIPVAPGDLLLVGEQLLRVDPA